MADYKITFQPGQVMARAHDSECLLDVAFKAGISLKSSCGGTGACSQCKLIIRKGLVDVQGVGKLTREQLDQGYVLACQTYPNSDLEIEIPADSMLSEHKVLISHDEGYDSTSVINPLFQKIKIEVAAPSLDNHMDDLSRLYAALKQSYNLERQRISLEVMQHLPQVLREGDWKVTVSLADIKDCTEIINIEPGWDYRKYYGLALDIGTTTVVAHLVDLETGDSVGVEGAYNKQAVFGDDVISRIIYAVEHKRGLEQTQKTVLGTIDKLIANLIKDKDIEREDIWYVSCAGNTTMTHMFLGIDPEYIRLEPYVPASNSFIPIKAADLGLLINSKANVYCIPGVASYVGGDVTAGAEIINIEQEDKLTLFIDVGTNGELILGNREWLVACACSAGPAFEGGGISNGMRAMDGAIEYVRIEPDTWDVHFKTVSNRKPVGICGSGLIDCLAALQEAGVMDRTGSFSTRSDSNRLRITDGEKEFILVFAAESGNGKDITISESDVKNLIRSKAAIFAGIQTMLKTVDLPLETIEQVYIAGGFGRYINLEDAIKIGMFPDLPLDKYRYVGNSSIAGAKKILLSKETRDHAEKLAEKVTYLELSVGNDFYEEYTSALFIPHTNLDLFPSLKGPEAIS